MQEQPFGGRKVHVTDIAYYLDVTDRHAFRVQADVRETFDLRPEQKITIDIFAAYVKRPPHEVWLQLSTRYN